MTNLVGNARPYARAVYELAQQQKAVAVYQSILQFAGLLLKQSEVVDYVLNPKVSDKQAADLINEIVFTLPLANAQEREQSEIKNLIALLAEQRKLILLSAIADLFAQYAARDSQTEKVEVRSAVELDASTKETLVQNLAQKLQKQIDINYQIDASLIGGAVIRTAQWVLDGSIKNQLQELKKFTAQT